MAHSSLRLPGHDLLEKMLYPGTPQPDATTVKRFGSSLGRRPKPLSAEPPEDPPEPSAPEPGMENDTAAVRLFNAAWDREQGEFEAEARVSVEGELPPEMAH